MRITAVSDLHGEYPTTTGGDLLIVAGDCTASDKISQWQAFFEWFEAQQYEKKVLVAGNHDGFLEQCAPSELADILGVREDPWYDYLQDTSTTYCGLKIYGSPWTPMFCNWHFMLPRNSDAIAAKWDLIPDDVDILVTHGPAYGTMDLAKRGFRDKLTHVGCERLEMRMEKLWNLKLHVFGHIHEGYGILRVDGMPIYVNAAHMNEHYKPVNAPVDLVL